MKRGAIAAVLLLVLTGCGVRPTGVLLAGRPPVGLAKGPVLYFVAEGRLRPVLRATGQLGTVTAALELLVAGPSDAELEAGLGTAVPKFAPGTVSADDPVTGVLTVHVPMPLSELSPLAAQQLICTAVGTSAMAGGNGQWLMVRLAYGGIAVEKPAHCPVTR